MNFDLFSPRAPAGTASLQAFADNAFQSLAVACPTCRSRVGARCIRPSGHGAADLHRDRGALADAEFVRIFGQAAEIDFDPQTDRWGVRRSRHAEFIAHATRSGRLADREAA